MAHATALTHDRLKRTKKTASLVDVVVDVAAVLTADVVQIAGDEADAVTAIRGDLHLHLARALHEYHAQPCPK